jgi:phosphatidylserine/phosphatidylglycerophosphate/cardiolipin synthase-like enzyme
MAKTMRKIVLFLSLLLSAQMLLSAPNITSNLELVESIPLESIYGQQGVMQPQSVWLDMVNNAQKKIDIGAFYFISAPHSAMTPVVEAIKKAAERGVQVRLLLDESFKFNSQTAINELAPEKNIELRFMPMKFIAGGVLHAKYMVVDDEKIFVGSQNFDDCALNQNHEIGLYINNQRLALTILNVFNADWEKSGGIASKQISFVSVTKSDPLIINTHQTDVTLYPAFSPESITPDGLNSEIKELTQLLDQAKHEVLIQVMQYSANAGYKQKGYWEELDNAIRRAAGRGVRVNMIVADWALSKSSLPYIKSLSVMPNIHIKYSAIPKYQEKFIPYSRVEHCKYMVIDKKITWIGTGNWEKDYFYNSRDLAIIIKGKYPAQELRRIFYHDWFGPYVNPINPSKTYTPPKTH